MREAKLKLPQTLHAVQKEYLPTVQEWIRETDL